MAGSRLPQGTALLADKHSKIFLMPSLSCARCCMLMSAAVCYSNRSHSPTINWLRPTLVKTASNPTCNDGHGVHFLRDQLLSLPQQLPSCHHN